MGLSAVGAFALQQLQATGVCCTNADYEKRIVKINKNDNREKNLCVVQPFSFLRSKLISQEHLANVLQKSGSAFQCKTGIATLHRPLILSERVIIAIRSGRAIKAEVCVARTCQHFINKVNHGVQPRIGPTKNQDQRERTLSDSLHQLHSKGQQLFKARVL